MASTAPRDGGTSLHVPLTPLVGREREVAAVRDLLDRGDVRLITLTGPGGVGKTRLALRVAAEVALDFADGVQFVSLAAISDPDLVASTIAQTLELVESDDQPPLRRLQRVLETKKVLLVLDNFEQVVAVAPLVGDLLTSCPELRILVTSRETLRIEGEHEFSVPPLALPDRTNLPPLPALATCEAVALFLQRARAVNLDFAMTDDNAPIIAEICARLDGLPLAIELAAARVKVLSPSDLLARLTNRLSLLGRDARDRPPRHQTMRNAIAWSYDLLESAEQALFRRLSVLVGGCTVESAEAVAGDSDQLGIDVLDRITSLLDKSLLRRVDALDGAPRFAMFETVREFGLEQLAVSDETDEVRRRYAVWCLALAEQAFAEVYWPAQRQWLTRLESEHDNVRAVLTWALEQENAETAQRLAGDLARFWYLQGHLNEGRSWADRALAMSGQTSTTARAKVLGTVGLLAWAQGDFERADRSLHESLSIWRGLDHAAGIAATLWRLGLVAEDQGAYDRATAFHEEALGLNRELGDRAGVAHALNALGVVAYERGDTTRAAALFEEARSEYRTADHDWGLGIVLSNLGRIARARGDYARASALFTESLALQWEQAGQRLTAAGSLRGLASIAALTGHFERAVRLFGAAETLRAAIDAPVPRHHTQSLQALQQARAALGEQAFAANWEIGLRLPLAEAVAEALTPLPDAPAGAASDQATTRAEQLGLTRKEVEVLRLLRDGLTNREIGARLYISPRTAQTHVQNIFAKLDVGTRSAAAAFAVEHRLV